MDCKVISCIFNILLLNNVVFCHDPTIYMKYTFPDTRKVDGYNTIVVEKDKDCTLSCVIDKKPKTSELQWVAQIYRSNTTIAISTSTDTQNSFKYQLDKPATNIFRLKVQNVQVDDQGLYICRVQLHTQQFANVSRMIKVVQRPQVIDIFTSSNMVKEEGAPTELKCAADGIPKPLISWERAGGGILPSGGRELVSSSLKISKVNREHQGVYKCIAKNTAGMDVRRIKLDVKFTPRLASKAREVFQAVGYKRELKCEASGNPTPTKDQMMWFRNGNLLSAGKKYTFENYFGSNYVLMKMIIHDIVAEDYGQYSCYAENMQGSGETTILLTRSDTEVPDRLVAPSTGHLLSLSWTLIFTQFMYMVLIVPLSK
ncbi:protein amalgam-like [Mya arenaria]|uniref:protein amalgam-like n=1 Tax=Mya arenaria TaxID=6604 RepID=UPI0022E809BD|nr:protein amalgam-like [Mya arenaria]